MNRATETTIAKILTDKFKFNEQQIRKLAVFADELELWNKRMNLTGFKNMKDITEKGIYSSALITNYLKDGEKIIDAGGGNGLPGIVISILKPSVHLTAVDTSIKSAAFLKSVMEKIEIANFTFLQEDVIQHKEKYNCAISMATFKPHKWLEIGKTLLKRGGRVFLLSGNRPSISPNPHSLKLEGCYTHLLPLSKIPRTITIFVKNQ